MNAKKGLVVVMAMALGLLLGFSGSAGAGTTYDGIATIPATTGPYYFGYTSGYQFTVGPNPIWVTHLGTYETSNTTLYGDTPVAMWELPHKVAEITLTTSNTTLESGVGNGFWYASISPVTLKANTAYRVASYPFNAEGYSDSASPSTCSSGITYDGRVLSPYQTGFSYPSTLNANSNTSLGGSFKFTLSGQSHQAIATIPVDITGPNTYDYTMGYQFTVGGADILVTHLGAYETSNTNLDADVPVAIWTVGTPKVAEITLTTSNTTLSGVGNGFWYAELESPVRLEPNTTYRVGSYAGPGGYGPGEGYADSGSTSTCTAGITYDGRVLSAAYQSGLSYPLTLYTNSTSIGGSFMFTTEDPDASAVPEPAGLGLIGMALLVLRRRRG